MLNTEELDILLVTKTVEEIVADHGAELDEPARAYLGKFAAFEEELTLLGEEFRLAPAPQTTPDPRLFEGRKSLSWWRRPLAIPAWASLAAAALCLVLILTHPFAEVDPKPDAGLDLKTLLAAQRSAPEEPMDRFDQQVFQALSERAIHYIERDTPEHYKLALADLEAVHRMKPNDTRLLRYLVLTCDSLGLSTRKNTYQKLLDNASGRP